MDVDEHAHHWARRQNVTTRGTVMPAYEVCACGAARPAADTAEVRLASTGNGVKSHDRYDTFLFVSGGEGNLDPVGEVHLKMLSNDGEFAQGWFSASDLLRAIGEAAPHLWESRG